MHSNPQHFLPLAIFAVVIVFGIYRRLRRTIGRQRLRPTALTFRVMVLVLLSCMVLFSAHMTPTALLYALGGAVLGAAVAAYALVHTRFERTDQDVYYTPHLYIGIAVSLLLVVRVAYRFMTMYSHPEQYAQQAPPDPMAGLLANPLTLAFVFLTIGYYLVYCCGLLLRARDVPRASG